MTQLWLVCHTSQRRNRPFFLDLDQLWAYLNSTFELSTLNSFVKSYSLHQPMQLPTREPRAFIHLSAVSLPSFHLSDGPNPTNNSQRPLVIHHSAAWLDPAQRHSRTSERSTRHVTVLCQHLWARYSYQRIPYYSSNILAGDSKVGQCSGLNVKGWRRCRRVKCLLDAMFLLHLKQGL